MPTDEPSGNDKLRRFEQSLRQIRPVAPPPLDLSARRPRWRIAAIAAVVLLGTALLIVRRGPRLPDVSVRNSEPPRTEASRPLTSSQLQTALLKSDEDFNRLLDDTSPGILTHGHSGTVLYELGKE